MADGLRQRIVGIFALLLVANLLAWGWALVAFAGQPVLIGTAFLAFSLGLRHRSVHAPRRHPGRSLEQKNPRPARLRGLNSVSEGRHATYAHGSLSVGRAAPYSMADLGEGKASVGRTPCSG